MKLKNAFPDSAIRRIYTPWVKAINSRECLSVINIPKRDQLYRIDELKRNRLFGDDIKLVPIDLKGEIVEDPNDLRKLINNKHTDSGRPRRKVEVARMTLKKTCLIILDADQLLDEKVSLLSYLDKLYHDNQSINILYLFQKNITHPRLTKYLSPYTSLYQNISLFRFQKAEMSHFIKFISTSFAVKLTGDLEKAILDKCGPSPWLIKECVRYYYQSKDSVDLFNHDSLNLKLNILWQELGRDEKKVIDKVLKKESVPEGSEREGLNYLIKTGLLIKKYKKIILTIPLFANFCKKLIQEKNKIGVNQQGQVMAGNVIIEGFFSRREKRVIKLLLQNQGGVVRRDTLGKAVWQTEVDDKYTDWALDQIIKRLRNKLEKLGLDRHFIKTVKNQGYLLNGDSG